MTLLPISLSLPHRSSRGGGEEDSDREGGSRLPTSFGILPLSRCRCPPAAVKSRSRSRSCS